MKKVKLLKRRVLAISMALAMILSSLVVSQGVITAYAEDEEPTLTAQVGSSSYSATQIENGDFELTTPWESYVLNGVTYTSKPNPYSLGTITAAIPNGVGEGWNTTENSPYQGSLFEVWSINNSYEPKNRDYSGNGQYFIEMNANNSACLYQDLATQGGDVIKWTLQHADRSGLGYVEQRMYVTIGAPIMEYGKIKAAWGVNTDIHTEIQDVGKADYRYNKIEVGSAEGVAFANPKELEGLSVTKGALAWRNVAGIYVVPEGQDVTRFAFCADSSSYDEILDKDNKLSGGNFLDNITFSTLIGNIKATKQTEGDVDITGYWGDTDQNKKLIVKVGENEHEINMKDVCEKNFVINVPKSIIDEAGSSEIQVYHQDYRSATTKVTVSHVHDWQYEVGTGENANQLFAFCNNTTDAGSCQAQGDEHKKPLTLNADDAEYTGKPYTGASIKSTDKTEWIKAGLDAPQIYYKGTSVSGAEYASSPTAPTNAGTYKATITAGGKTAEAEFTISPKFINTGSGMSVTVSPKSYEYTGDQIIPAVVVKDGSKVLSSTTDYTLSGASTGIAKGTYSVTITGDGNYTGTTDKTWTITPKPITSSDITVTIDSDSYVHDGGVKTPVITVKDGANTLTEGTHYTLSGNTTGSAISGDADYKITVQGIGNYSGTVDKTWKIVSSGSGSGGSGGSGSGGSGGSGSGSSSGGAGGTQPTTPTENFDIPVKNENTVKVEAEIKDGTANVSEITNKTIEKVVNNKDAESKVDTITIDLSGAKQEVTGVTLSKESVKTLAETTAQKDNGIDTATIELSKATVELDHKALETLAEQAKGTQIQLVVEDKDRRELNSAQQATLDQHQVATTFEAYFTSDGQRIHDFKGGKAVVSIDFTPEAGKDTSYYHMVYVAESGDMTRYKTKYENRKLMFTTTHFSDYAVIYDTGEKNETEKTEEEKKDNGSGTDGKVTMDTSYSRLRLRIPTSTKTTNVLKWTKQTGADGYVIYGNHCNTGEKKYKMVQRVVIKDGSTTTWVDKNLDGGTYYKYYIKAYKLVNGKKVWLAKSKVVHSTTTGGKYGNAKTVKVNQTVLSLTKGKTFAIKAEQVIKDKPIDEHQDIKYESSNTKVASVTGKGVIKAKKKGTCYIYVYAQNGMYRRMKVTVK